MPAFPYRLQPLLDQKVERKQEAERAQVERRKGLRESEARLAELQSRQGELETARTACRTTLLSGESTGEEIRRRRDDLSLATRRVEDIKDEVMAQRIEIEERVKGVPADVRYLLGQLGTADRQRQTAEHPLVDEAQLAPLGAPAVEGQTHAQVPLVR